MAFFKMSSSCACRRLAARSWRNSAAVAGSNSAPVATATGRRHGRKRVFLPLVQAFGVNVQGAGRGLGRAAFTGQAKGLGPEGGVIAPTFAGWGTVFHDVGKIRPYSVQIYSTTSLIITRLDRAAGIISGTFAFTLAKPGCDTVRVTQGRFDKKL